MTATTVGSAELVKQTTYASIGIQVITGLLGIYGLSLPVAPGDTILQTVLQLELVVQAIELAFYTFFISNFSLTGFAASRYFDWVLSTPLMLFTMAIYFTYEHMKLSSKELTIVEFIKENQWSLAEIIGFNFLMLLFGYLGEIGVIDRLTAFTLGTACFARSFYILYTNFAQTTPVGKTLFEVLFVVWALYGAAFLAPTVQKNIGYNILDIIAKNFFGVFLVVKLLQASQAKDLEGTRSS
jgi:bacteriorhodopsin